jgi:hypothetical protein
VRSFGRSDYGAAVRGSPWWSTAPPGRRLAFALVLLAGEALLFVQALAEGLHGFVSWAWLVTTPLLVPFFAYQAWRALRDLRGPGPPSA